MKNIRRSLAKDRISPPTAAPSPYASQSFGALAPGPAGAPITPLSAGGGGTFPASLARSKGPPQSVIRAVAPYRARRIIELSFVKGDFFHVEGERSDADGDWWEASNPATGARGIVPRVLFEVLGRSGGTQAPGNNSKSSMLNLGPATGVGMAGTGQPFAGAATPPPLLAGGPPPLAMGMGLMPAPGPAAPGQASAPRARPLYGVVQHDFTAERGDELEARRGEPIIIIAQSNHEWFVAKPIGRLGGPGLIPVAFVEVQDMVTGQAMPSDQVQKLIRNEVVPKVEEWKKATAAYKGNSIPLGRFDFPATPGSAGTPSGVPTPDAGASSALAGFGTSTPAPTSPSAQHQRSQSQSMRQQHLASSFDNSYGSSGPSSAFASPHMANHSISSNQGSHDLRSDVGTPPTDDYQQAPPPAGDQASGDNAAPHPDEGYATVEELKERYGVITHASVESFHFEQGHYWFHLRAHFTRASQENNGQGRSVGDTTTVLVLYRLYDDFYDFQIALMEAFPVEAGKSPDQRSSDGSERGQSKRILPMMPGPSSKVDELVCAQRVHDLSVYLADLCALPRYIRECELVYEFLGPREGDVELEGDPYAIGLEPDQKQDVLSQNHDAGADEVVEYLNRMGPLGGSGADDSNGAGSDRERDSRDPRGSYPPPAEYGNRYLSGSSMGSNPAYAASHSSRQEQRGAPSPVFANVGSGTRSNGGTATVSSTNTTSGSSNITSPPSSSHSFHASKPSNSSTSQLPLPPAPSSSAAISSSSLTRVSLTQTASTTTTTSSNTASQGFHRIKIYQRKTDDLIAIRVPTQVTRDELLERVRERIGSHVNVMRWRDEGGQGFASGGTSDVNATAGGRLVAIDNDKDLSRWFSGGHRMVLYAE